MTDSTKRGRGRPPSPNTVAMRQQTALLRSVPDYVRDPLELAKYADLVASGEAAVRELLRRFPKDMPREHVFDTAALPDSDGVRSPDAIGWRTGVLAEHKRLQQRSLLQRRGAASSHSDKTGARAHAVFEKNLVLLGHMGRTRNPLSANAVATRLHDEWNSLPEGRRLSGEDHLTARGDDHPVPTVRTLINWLGRYGKKPV